MGRVFFKFSIISRNERIVGQQQYQASEFLADIYNGVFSDLENEAPISEYRRTLQRGYVNKLLSSVYNSANDNDVAIILKQQIESVKQSCDKALQKQTDATTKAHLNAISAMIQQWQGKKPTS